MSDDGGLRPDPTSGEERFTVPIPSRPAPQPVSSPAPPTAAPPSGAPQSMAPPAAGPPLSYPPPTSPPVPHPPPAVDRQQTQVLPVSEPTRALPPPPWAGGPVPAAPAAPVSTPPATPSFESPPDPLLAHIGAALFWITVGWWVTVLVRLLGTLVREGPISTLFLVSVGRWPEETIVASVISVLAALVLLLGRGSRGRDLLGWASGALALVTVAVAIWRILP
ncbi:hypothetical protein FHX52_3803 [Humibacillus xanthopallidus]|uniref:Uncharacterized protein n=1 Tax=Humibacillus xanthopallidus TaxID=412689 RepID=A0A543PKI9_9MICO|nr:hypothetical protein [Humibacillus xanthopallidus]TQN44587.1 hypothetical protein FHX52_3803 [Humibacillus xanthopallidus]